MRCLTKGQHFNKKHIWFEKINSLSEIGGQHCDTVLIHANPIPLTGKWCASSKQYSLMSDLTLSEDEIYQKLTKTVRNEINRSKREEVHVGMYSSEEVLNNFKLMDEFATVYHNMYSEKGMEDQYLNTHELIAYAQSGKLLITVANIDGMNVVFHSYLLDGNNSRLLHSCSEFRVTDNAMRNAIGRANKYLHWHDILYLKQQGVKQYDWGGIASHDEPNGIDKFKMAFGGKMTEYYNVLVTYSLRAKLLTTIRKLKSKK